MKARSTSKYFCFRTPTFLFSCDLLMPGDPPSWTSIWTLKQGNADKKNRITFSYFCLNCDKWMRFLLTMFPKSARPGVRISLTPRLLNSGTRSKLASILNLGSFTLTTSGYEWHHVGELQSDKIYILLTCRVDIRAWMWSRVKFASSCWIPGSR